MPDSLTHMSCTIKTKLIKIDILDDGTLIYLTNCYYPILIYTVSYILHTRRVYECWTNVLFINYGIVDNKIFLILCKKLKEK